MNRKRLLATTGLTAGTLLLVLLALSSATFAGGGVYDLGWWKVGGGGGSASGRTFTLAGTIGQPEAGALSGGNYTLVGGFWIDAGPSSFKVYLPVVMKGYQ